MAKIAIHNMSGILTGELELNDGIFGIEPNCAVVQEIVVAQLANRRRGTASTKRRDEVRGGGRKPHRQKGTGRARAGSTRSPLWVGGGSIFGPKPRKYTQRIPRKKKQLALKIALAERLRDGSIVVLDKIELEEIKTKPMMELLRRLEATRNTLFILDKIDDKLEKSVRNIPFVKILTVQNINTYDLLKYHKIIFNKPAIAEIEESLISEGK